MKTQQSLLSKTTTPLTFPVEDFKLLINGNLEDGASATDVINPATELPFAKAPRASKDQLNKAVAAAKAAFPGWAATPIATRRAALIAVADVIQSNPTELARILTQEQGKSIDAATREVQGAAFFFRYFSALDLPVKVLEDSPKRLVELHRKPLGVIGAIVAWNFPLILIACKVPAALLAGNTIVLKAAPTTPLSTLCLAALIKDLLPPGVLNVLADSGELGPEMTSHPGIRKISFTGSTETGKNVMAGAAGTLKRITLELGGNDAAIVLSDNDPKTLAPKLFAVAFENTGQACIAVKRLYVHESIYDAVCDELAVLANQAVIGDGLEKGTQFGPLHNKMQYDKVMDLIADARLHGGKVIAGGVAPDRKGYFIRPTIVRDITDGTRLVDEEQFGPVLPVIKFSDDQDAVNRANASVYGLGGSVWSTDLVKARALAERIDSGTVWINQHMELAPNIPLNGARFSGLGVELGEEGLAEFTQVQVINMAR